MSDIKFNQEYTPLRNYGNGSSKAPFLVRLLIKLRLAKNEEVANYILVAFATAAFTLSVVIFYNVLSKPGESAAYYQPPISKDFAWIIAKREFPAIPSELINRLPDYFYREDLPSDIIKLLPQDFVNLIPQEPKK